MKFTKSYTLDNRHPEDVIYDVKKFINELTKVQEVYFQKLIENLKINKEGENWLFDYIYNSEEGCTLSFEEYLESYSKQYDDFQRKENLDFISPEETAEIETDFPFPDQCQSKENEQNIYGVYHKPTKLWVYFREYKDKFKIVDRVLICLCLKNDAYSSASKNHLEELILRGEFNGVLDYGQSNRLEFEIKKI